LNQGGETPPLREINDFLKQNLKLELHPLKTIIRKPNQGMDFLGYVIFPHHKLLRTKTRKRMFKKIEIARAGIDFIRNSDNKTPLKLFRQTIMSYMGACSHAEAFEIEERLRDIYREEYRKCSQINKNKRKV
jgi:hypothetical protein